MSPFCPLKQHRAKECMVLGYAEGGLAGHAEGKWAPDHEAFSTLTGGNECCSGITDTNVVKILQSLCT